MWKTAERSEEFSKPCENPRVGNPEQICKGLSNRFSVISSRACREELLHLFFPAGQVQVLPVG